MEDNHLGGEDGQNELSWLESVENSLHNVQVRAGTKCLVSFQCLSSSKYGHIIDLNTNINLENVDVCVFGRASAHRSATDCWLFTQPPIDPDKASFLSPDMPATIE